MQKMNCRLLTHSKTKDRDQPRNTKLHTTVGLGCLYNKFFSIFRNFSHSEVASLPRGVDMQASRQLFA